MRNFPTISATATKLQDKVTTLAPLIKRRSCPSRELPVTVIRKTLARIALATAGALLAPHARSEEHTSELQSLMRISYAVFCLNKKKRKEQVNRKQATSPHTKHTETHY